ncbi:MAG TPA: RNA methyltransferase [Acidobacteriota bacterium]|nr:RNA methyltransferase [Acidobacteriota bacterium]
MSITRAELKNLKSLGTRKGRAENRLFAADGVRLLEEALRHRFRPRTLYYAPALLSERARRLVDDFASVGVPTVILSAREMQSAAATRAPQGVLGVFDLPEQGYAQLQRPYPRRILLVEGLSDPGNLGTLMRSALAFKFELLLLAGASAEAYAPKVVRASAGAIFGLPVMRLSPDEVWALMRAGRFTLIGTAQQGCGEFKKLESAVKHRRFIVAVGSEAEGLSADTLGHSDLLWRVSHSTAVESLNAAVAGSIVMKQVYDVWQ